MFTMLGVAMSDAGIETFRWPLSTKVVARALPFHVTSDAATKSEPLTPSSKSAPPAVARKGTKPMRLGLGLLSRADPEEPDPPPHEVVQKVNNKIQRDIRRAYPLQLLGCRRTRGKRGPTELYYITGILRCDNCSKIPSPHAWHALS
jgi:hypothetical protein